MVKSYFITGIKKSIPIILGYIPIGLAFGVLATQQGLSSLDIFFMSLVVYAGASQFIATAMIISGINSASIIFTTFLINLRHLLMSASLSPYLKHISSPIQALISFGLTDETYAVDITYSKDSKLPASFYVGLHMISHIVWVASTVVGGILGNLMPNATRWGIDYALSAMFIGLLCMHIKDKKDVLVALCSGGISIFLSIKISTGWNIIIATILAATIGVNIELWNKKSSLLS